MDRTVWCMEPMRPLGELAARAFGCPLLVGDAVPECDVVHVVGMIDPPEYAATLSSTRAARRRVIHWRAWDVQSLATPTVLPEAVHVADSENLRRALADAGLDATVVPWPTLDHYDLTPLPAEPVVAAYFGGTPDQFGAPVVMALEGLMPDVPFVTYMDGHHDARGMQGIVDGTRVHLRLPDYDGGAMSAKEFMEAGRRAIVTQELPFAQVVRPDDLDGIVLALREALSHDTPDEAAAEYWRKENSDARWLEQMGALLEDR